VQEGQISAAKRRITKSHRENQSDTINKINQSRNGKQKGMMGRVTITKSDATANQPKCILILINN